MQLICPNCGEKIAAEHINIQRMVAVCPACDTVFAFDAPADKAKRRKVKQPEHLTLRDADTLQMTFRTNFRLDKNETFVSSSVLSFVFTFLTVLLISGYFANDVPIIMPIVFGLVALASYYLLALTAFNATHIEMRDDTITISRRPLPNPFQQSHQIDLDGVIAILCEETPVSRREAYDTPRYRVWAEMANGSRQIIVNDVVADYAYFITQCLNERLDADEETDVSRLVYDAENVEEEQGEETIILKNGKNRQP